MLVVSLVRKCITKQIELFPTNKFDYNLQNNLLRWSNLYFDKRFLVDKSVCATRNPGVKRITKQFKLNSPEVISLRSLASVRAKFVLE